MFVIILMRKKHSIKCAVIYLGGRVHAVLYMADRN